MTTQQRHDPQPTVSSRMETPAKSSHAAKRKLQKGTTKVKPTQKTAQGNRTLKRPSKPGGVRKGTKTAEVITLLERAKGTTLAELMKVTGWQAHSVRGFLSGTLGKKLGLKIESQKPVDGLRTYSIRH